MKTQMKTGIALIITSIVALAILSACTSVSGSGAPKQQSIDASYEGKEVQIAEGGTLTVALESNASTGFKWELVQTTGGVIELSGSKYEESETPLVGAAGVEVWTFKALGRGISTIKMEYSQPWAGGAKAFKTFNLTVVVK